MAVIVNLIIRAFILIGLLSPTNVLALNQKEISIMRSLNVLVKFDHKRKSKPYSIPEGIEPSKLIKTERLVLSGVAIVEMPSWIKEFTKVKTLNLSKTELVLNQNLLDALSNMPELENLYLSDNPSMFSGELNLSSVWERLTELRNINLSNTGANQGDIGSLAPLKHLVKINFNNNKLTSLKPLAITDKLIPYGHFSNNQISFSDLEMESLSFNWADFSDNNISGEVFQYFDKNHLEEIKLSGNSSIKISNKYGSPFKLQYLTGATFHPNVVIPDGLKKKLAKIRLPVLLSELEASMVDISGGTFEMGCLSNDSCSSDEKPHHTVTVQSFEMSATEVSFELFDACVDDGECSQTPNDRNWGRGNRPVINVSWDDTQEFIHWLNQKTERQFRLPSEAEWEYAARARSKTKYSWGDEINCKQANYEACGLSSTQPVKSYDPNAWGLYEMHGNVWEWVSDCWNDSYEFTPASDTGGSFHPNDGSSWGTGDCSQRVIRGGSWVYDATYLRSAYRYGFTRDDRFGSVGFRLSRSR